MCELCSEVVIKKPERRHSGVVIVKFEHIPQLFWLLILNK